jgi:hypothetical protein
MDAVQQNRPEKSDEALEIAQLASTHRGGKNDWKLTLSLQSSLLLLQRDVLYR